MTRYSRRRLAAGALSLTAGASLAVLTGCGSGRVSPEPQPAAPAKSLPAPGALTSRVKVVHPTKERLLRVTTQPAHVEPYERIDVYAMVPGYVAQLGQVAGAGGGPRDVDLGDRVAKGQRLVLLAVPELDQDVRQKEAALEKARTDVGQAEAAVRSADAMAAAVKTKLDQARADIARSEAEVAYRKGEYERYQRLVGERSATPEQAAERYNQYQASASALDGAKAGLATGEANLRVEVAKQAQARADVAGANARLKVAEAALAQSRIVAGYADIKAEFAGVITRRSVDTGAFVRSAVSGQPQPLFSLARVDRMRIVANVPEGDSAWVAIGQPATVKIDALTGQELKGRVARLADALDPSTRTMRVEVELDKLPAGLRPGQFGSVAITLADYPDAVMLPTIALASGSSPSVMIVKNGRAERCDVRVGMNDGVRVQVLSGLTGDEAIITDGKNSVADGQPVSVVE